MKTNPTPERNLGARAERRDILAHVRTLPAKLDRDALITWIATRKDRTGKITGGVGKK